MRCRGTQLWRTRLGEAKLESPRIDIDRGRKIKFHGSDTSTDAGLLTYHELDDALRLSESAEDVLLDVGGGKNIRHLPMGLRRRRIGTTAALAVVASGILCARKSRVNPPLKRNESCVSK